MRICLLIINSVLLQVNTNAANALVKGGSLEPFELIKYFTIFSAVVAAVAIGYGAVKGIYHLRNGKSKRYEAERTSFENLVGQLVSDNKTSQLAAAILLRQYFDEKRMPKRKRKQGYFLNLKSETINLISSVLRVVPSGVFQKTLADGLAFAKDLSNCDLQKTNLQDAFLDNKEGDLIMRNTDLYLADLSYANLTGIEGNGIILYKANLFHASIKNCNFTNANFRGANLTGATFKCCTFNNADFTGAQNIPKEINDGLTQIKDKGGKANLVYKGNGLVSAKHITNGKTIFFSMPGVMKKDEEILTKEYKLVMEGRGYNVIYYTPDKYPGFGQFDKVKGDIGESVAMIVFGFKQVQVEKGTCRPGTKDEHKMDDKWFSTSWNDIEGGMGLMGGLPILLVYDFALDNGVFNPKLSECHVLRISIDEDVRNIENNPVFREWLSRFE